LQTNWDLKHPKNKIVEVNAPNDKSSGD
jgi:hypothetical protein